ncbi:MAG: tetratricopeptide repeat protein [Bacteroidetes bacterium]|nr:tetratricopeptide repeat protein [Bacteroidota bacterium]
MKKHIVILLFVLVTGVVLGQKKNKAIPQINNDSLAYSLAMQVGDTNAAINSLYQMIGKSPKNTDKLHLLASIYFEKKQYNQCINTCTIILNENDKHIKCLQLLAVCYQEMKNSTNAIFIYKKLDSLAPESNYKYQIATIFYQKRNFQEALNTLGIIISDTLSGNESIQMNYQNKNKQNVKQNVSVRAAAYNMAGYILMENGDMERAKSLFEKSLEIEPTFELAKGNRDSMPKK